MQEAGGPRLHGVGPRSAPALSGRVLPPKCTRAGLGDSGKRGQCREEHRCTGKPFTRTPHRSSRPVSPTTTGLARPSAGRRVKAFVSLRPSVDPTADMERELLAFGRRKLGPAVAPREIAFDQNLPKTRSGKVMRRLLRARELGLPAGDLSTLEGST
ncbi:AMP-binding enzyme [Streptomyces variegatus]|uniref:AMP-binding enzyme n=1 Tax=Streptomyces variegatus TaxID=284040 RepID=UPI002277329D|nr:MULTISPECIES: hypothetical protein [Streptomyces]